MNSPTAQESHQLKRL